MTGAREWNQIMVKSTPERTRPLSPNVQIYRPQLTSLLSIANRITGVILSASAVVLVVWLIAAATGPPAYAEVQGAIASWIGQIVLFGATFAFFLQPLRRHPASRVGHRPRIRAPVDLRLRMVGCSGERGPHRGGLGRQLAFGRVEPVDHQRVRSPLGRPI